MRKGVFILCISFIFLLIGCGKNSNLSGDDVKNAAVNTVGNISNESNLQPVPSGANNINGNTETYILDKEAGTIEILTEAFSGAYDGYYFFEVSDNMSSESFFRDTEQLKALEIFYGNSTEGSYVIMSREAAEYFGYENVDENCYEIYINSENYYALSNNALTAFLEPASGKIYGSKIIAGFYRGDRYECFMFNTDSSLISDVTGIVEDEELFYINKLLSSNQSIKKFKLSADGTMLLLDILEGASEELYIFDVVSHMLLSAVDVIGKEVVLDSREESDGTTSYTEAVWDSDGNLVVLEKNDTTLRIDKYDLEKNVYDTVMVEHSLEGSSIDLCAGGVYYEKDSKRFFLKFRDFLPMEIDEEMDKDFKQNPAGEKYACLSSDRDTIVIIDIAKGNVSKYALDKPCSYVEWADESTVRCCMGYEGDYIVFREVKI